MMGRREGEGENAEADSAMVRRRADAETVVMTVLLTWSPERHFCAA
jgi:hypothetical protein